MLDAPTVSAVIPCYNHARYVGEAIASALAQTWADLEIIVVNDGSTDNTADVVGQYVDPRVRYVYQSNRGLSAARNLGIQMARGRYVGFLDADDLWEPQFVERCVRVLEAAGRTVAGVYTRNLFVDERGALLPQVGGLVVHKSDFRERSLEGGFFPPAAVLVRRDAALEAGLFDTELTSEEDWDLWFRIGDHYDIESIEDPLVRYRVYPGSMSTNAARMHENRMRVLAKRVGPPDPDPSTWSGEKRKAYAFAYRQTCIGYLQQRQPDVAWSYLASAVSLWPNLLTRLDTAYELVCGDKPWGLRGKADLINVLEREADILARLAHLIGSAGLPSSLRGAAYGNVHLALGMLADQAGLWVVARGQLAHAIAAWPPLLASPGVARRLLKLGLGPRAVENLRQLLGAARSRDAGLKGGTIEGLPK